MHNVSAECLKIQELINLHCLCQYNVFSHIFYHIARLVVFGNNYIGLVLFKD